MMKICPNCLFQFHQRKQGCCPKCQKQIEWACGKMRLSEDKETVNLILEKIKLHVEKRDGVILPFEPSEYSRERKMAYDLVDRATIFLNAQKEKISITVRDFLLGLFDFILSQKRWYAERIDSLTMLYNKISDLAKEYYQLLRKEWIREKAEVERLKIYKTGAKIEYGI